MNNFKDQLVISEEDSRIDLIRRALASQFGESDFIPEKDLQRQSTGIDRYYGRFKIEYKIRETYYPDMLFEIVSNNVSGALGWAEKDLACDFFVYAFYDKKIVYIFYYTSLKNVWENNKHDWCIKYKHIIAVNNCYDTISVAVPIQEVLKETIHYLWEENIRAQRSVENIIERGGDL